MYGVTDGKRIGTYFEHKFQNMLSSKYEYEQGSSAKGIDFPIINVDMKVTSYQATTVFFSIQFCPSEDLRTRILSAHLRL